MKNPVIHFEIAADDVKKVEKFYKSVFDWKFNEIPFVNYTAIQTTETGEDMVAKTPGNINGGLMPKNDQVGGPNIVVSTDDIEKTLNKAKDAGGEVIMETINIPGIGLYARLKDTEGNEVGLVQPNK